MTRFEIEILAIALYESQARHTQGINGSTVRGWGDLSPAGRMGWRAYAREIHSEPTSA